MKALLTNYLLAADIQVISCFDIFVFLRDDEKEQVFVFLLDNDTRYLTCGWKV